MSTKDFIVCCGTDSGDDFLVRSDSIFVNDFWFCSSLYAMKISMLVVALGSYDDFWFDTYLVFVNDF